MIYSVKRISHLASKEFGETYPGTVGDKWVVLKDSDIFEGARRVNDKVLGKYNMEWITSGPVRYVIEYSTWYNRDYNNKKVDPYILKPRNEVVRRLIKDLSEGLIGVDNPKIDPDYSDRTHTLLKLSTPGVSIAYSKSINGYDRLTYEVFKPVVSNGVTTVRILLSNCSGHKFHGKSYSYII